MSATSQHEFHPDADSLNAFAEQALVDRERGDVLAHLAVCGRCRQVVALAREAAEAELAASPVPRTPIRANSWLRGWRLALAPAAALVATAAFAIYFHERDAERTAEMAKSEPPAITQIEKIPANPAQPKVAPPAAAPSAKGSQPASSDHALKPPLRRAAPAAVPPPEAPAVMSQLPMPLPMPGAESAPGAGAREEGSVPSRANGGEMPRDEKSMPAVSEFKQEQRALESQRQQAQTAQSRILAAKEWPPASEQDTSGPPPSNAASSVESSSAQLEVRVEPSPSLATKKQLQLGGLFSARMKIPTRLPSGLPAVSIAEAEHCMLAIDREGALFLSQDSGNTWEHVDRQWTGRAVMVRVHADSTAASGAAPAAQLQAAPANPGAAPSPPPLFEILNDKSQLWLSTDGKIWLPK